MREGFGSGHAVPAPDPDTARVFVPWKAEQRQSPRTDGKRQEVRPPRGIGARYMWVILAGWGAALPAAFVTATEVSSPLLGVLLRGVFSAFGAGLFAMVPGALTLLVG